jgi:hypothetical protein
MNDEDFARHAFAAAFRSGQTGEPPTLPDVELLARNGRRANRTRHGAYAAGSTVLAGAAVVGVVSGPTLLGLGSPSTSGIGTGTQGAASTTPKPSASTSTADVAKPSPGVPCTTPPAISWLGVVNGALPAGVTATADQSASCVQTPDGSHSVEAMFKLSSGTVELQVNVQTGPDIAAKLSAAASTIKLAPASLAPTGSLDPATLTSLQASKMAAASAAGMNSASAVGTPPPSPAPSLDAAAIASLEAYKQSLGSAGATASPAPGASQGDGTKPSSDETCAPVGSDENVCVSHMSKGSLSVVDAQLLRTGGGPLLVEVVASNGKDVSTPAAGQLPSDATMRALAQAVAAHF